MITDPILVEMISDPILVEMISGPILVTVNPADPGPSRDLRTLGRSACRKAPLSHAHTANTSQ